MAPTHEDVDLRSKRGTHSTFDYSSFIDAEVLRVRETNFFISSSYLALHSPFFYDYFINGDPHRNGWFELDVDPHNFGDLLDIIYPCFKKTNCCQECSSSFINRLDLALELKLRWAVRRLLSDVMCTEEIARTLIEHNAYETYKECFPKQYSTRTHLSYEAVKGTTRIKRDDSDDLAPMILSTEFPDAIYASVEGITFLVSSSMLGLHSEKLRYKIRAGARLPDPIKFDVGLQSFTTFQKAAIGILPPEWSRQFLDDLIVLGATYFYDYYMDKIKRDLSRLPSKFKTKAVIALLSHYRNQSKLDRPNF
ncbi:hypothetical protein PFISCL1PPCAC_4088, partial [Pristionchus fissidentatus]